jgi:hypothetical protein
MTYLFFFVLLFAFTSLIAFFRNWEDEQPDLGGFGVQRND